MRDIEAAYKDALIEEYEGYVRAGRKVEAEQVAEVLKDRYGHDVAKKDGDVEKEPAPAPERADADKAPETAVDPKPRRTTRAKPSPGEDK